MLPCPRGVLTITSNCLYRVASLWGPNQLQNRPVSEQTRLLSRKEFKVNKNAKVCSNHFKFGGRPVDSHPHPTLFQKGYNRGIVTRMRKAPIDRLPVQQIRSEKKKSDTDSIQREKKRNNIVDTPKKLLWSFTVVFIGKKAIIITSKHGTTIFFPLQSYSSKTLWEKLPRKARVNIERVSGSCSYPLGSP